MQSSLWYWWLSHFVALLASVPGPGCSLIYNQNIKSIVSPSWGGGRGGTLRQFNKADIVPRVGNHLATGREFQDAQMEGGYIHVHTLIQSQVFHKMFLIFVHGKEVKIKVFISPQKLTRHFFPFNPFNTKLFLTFKTFTGSTDICGRKTNEGMRWAPSDYELWQCCTLHYFYFSNQTNTMTTYFQDHVYFAESHILNTGSFVEGKQLTVRPCLCSK